MSEFQLVLGFIVQMKFGHYVEGLQWGRGIVCVVNSFACLFNFFYFIVQLFMELPFGPLVLHN